MEFSVLHQTSEMKKGLRESEKEKEEARERSRRENAHHCDKGKQLSFEW